MKAPRSAQSARPTDGAKQNRHQKRAQAARLHHMHQQQELERVSFRMSREDAEMWRDYRIFKIAGLLHEWSRLYAARLPVNFRQRPTL